jgi:exodeoxyribonuclease V beta subunit
MSARQPFTLTGPMPRGTVVLEASAGTGKTFTIAGLVTRAVAEGATGIEQALVLTFNRSAAKELRGRIRARLRDTAAALARPADPDDDALVTLLRDGASTDTALRRQRLLRALVDFDACVIATLHQWCARMLQQLGTAGDTDSLETFDEQPQLLRDQAAEIVFLTDCVTPDGAAFDPAVAVTLVQGATAGDPNTPLLPRDDPDAMAAARVAFAAAARQHVAGQRRRHARFGHDDQLTRLRALLTDQTHGAATAARLAAQYRVVLVDEFQDTDPVQWDILRALAHRRLPLVLIGDPKQAIYAFRGADVTTYLQAADHADDHRTLDHNWRSDPGVVRGVAQLLGQARLGDERIEVLPVTAALDAVRLHGAGPPVQVRLLNRDAGRKAKDGMLYADDARSRIVADLVRGVRYLLGGSARLTRADGTTEAVTAGDVAVLVRWSWDADMVQRALSAAGIPTVIGNARDVFRSPAAADWQRLLDALDAPGRPDALITAALTPLLTSDPAVVVEPAALDLLAADVARLRRAWDERGPLAVLDALVRAGLAARVIGTIGGERLLTDLRHVAEQLHEAASAGRLSTAAQRAWLAEQRREAAEDEFGERSRRLETDAQAVQVHTLHGAKGQEFPIVLLPFVGFARQPKRDPDTFTVHEDGRRVLHVGGPSATGYAQRLAAAQLEEAGEELRLLYVGLTRAASQVVAWWAPSRQAAAAPLTRVLFAPRPAGPWLVPPSVPVPNDDAVAARLHALAEATDGSLAVVAVAPRAGRVTRPAGQPELSSPAPGDDLTVAPFRRTLDEHWRRTSYSGLVRALHDEPGFASEPDDPGTIDEPEQDATLPSAPQPDEAHDRLASLISPWADLPGGAAFGTLVHGVLEGLDTTAADLDEAVRQRVERAVAGRVVTGWEAPTLVRGLVTAAQTPLGRPAGDVRLRDVHSADRLDELGFELPLAGGDAAGRTAVPAAVLGDLAGLLRGHLPADDPLAGYADALADPRLASRHLRGYLLGSIDTVLRLPHPDLAGETCYLVVDYKTNLLRDPDGAVSALAYTPAALTAAMTAAHYPLQALLYAVALHRFLRWRLGPRYRPDVHLGGVQYHFLRGMLGTDGVLPDGQVCGVFGWAVPSSLVVATSHLLAGQRGAA